MPIYKYRCPECQKEIELSLPMQDSGKPQFCRCGNLLERVMTVPNFKIVKFKDGGELVRDTLNREHKTLPAKQVELLAGGLNEPDTPVLGRGFG